MSGFVCPNCREEHDIFGSGGGEKIARELELDVLGRIPLEPGVRTGGDAGVPITSTQYPGRRGLGAAARRCASWPAPWPAASASSPRRSPESARPDRGVGGSSRRRATIGGLSMLRAPDENAPCGIAVISDLHANLPALRAVVDDAARIGCDDAVVPR